MGDVVQFPSFDERQWLEMETALIDGLAGLGLPGEQVEWIQSEWKRRMLAAIHSLQYSVQMPPTAGITQEAIEFAEAAVKQMEKQFRPIVANLAGQLLSVVAEMSAAHFNSAPPPAKMKAQILELIPGGKDKDAS